MSVIFPKWTNHLPTIAAAAAVLGGVFVVTFVSYYFSPRHTDVGYAPEQPIPYSHRLHAGAMAMDCRYCHTAVEQGSVVARLPKETERPATPIPPLIACR